MRPGRALAGVAIAAGLAACGLDPQAALRDAALHVQVAGLDHSDRAVRLEVVPAGAGRVVREAAAGNRAGLDFYVLELPAGALDLYVTTLDADGTAIHCIAKRGEVRYRGAPLDVPVDLASSQTHACVATGDAGTPDAGDVADAARPDAGVPGPADAASHPDRRITPPPPEPDAAEDEEDPHGPPSQPPSNGG